MVSATEAKPSRVKATRTCAAGGGTAARDSGVAAMSSADLAELLTTFNETTGRLQSAHEKLTGEVARLEKELRGANRQLRRARQLAALGEMAAGIAHEVRNPLGSIKLYAKVLCEDLTHMPEQAGVAGKIMGAVDRLNAVVGDVLSFSREITPNSASISAWDVVEGAVESCRDVAARLGVEMCVDEPAMRDFAMWGDAGLLTLALTNVVRNACEAVGEFKGAKVRRVTIHTEHRRVLVPGESGSGARREAAVLIVTDTGPGVPEEALARVFNPFFTTRHTGTGLGLAIVHRVVDAHGGSVSIRNNHDRTSGGPGGATVELVIPELLDSDSESTIPHHVQDHAAVVRGVQEQRA
jgi:two-component system sensor histidine kinase HydH